MKKYIMLITILLLAGIATSCSDDNDLIADKAKKPLNASDCYQTVHVGDEVTIKSLCGAQIFYVNPTYKKSDSATPTPISGTRYKGGLHHWLEASQTGDSTFVFKIHTPEASDTVTYMDAFICSPTPPLGEGTVTFHLVP